MTSASSPSDELSQAGWVRLAPALAEAAHGSGDNALRELLQSVTLTQQNMTAGITQADRNFSMKLKADGMVVDGRQLQAECFAPAADAEYSQELYREVAQLCREVAESERVLALHSLILQELDARPNAESEHEWSPWPNGVANDDGG